MKASNAGIWSRGVGRYHSIPYRVCFDSRETEAVAKVKRSPVLPHAPPRLGGTLDCRLTMLGMRVRMVPQPRRVRQAIPALPASLGVRTTLNAYDEALL